MGKASKWIMNLLLLVGRKEEKKDSAIFEQTEETSNGIWPPPTPVTKRWSFGRSPTKHRAKKSSVPKQAVWDLQSRQNQIDTVKTVAAQEPVRHRITREVADAAVKIQAVFRSYLARKALTALRGLVKLQALVRGHLVRKQTTVTLRRMHALMTIQVKARFQRAQKAEESQRLLRSKTSSRYRTFPQENESREAVDETQGVSRRKRGYLSRSGGGDSISRQDDNFRSSSTAQSTPRRDRETGDGIPGGASRSCQPNYMARTRSSRAKARSASEPKQRPEQRNLRDESKPVASCDTTTHILPRARSRRSSSQSGSVIHQSPLNE